MHPCFEFLIQGPNLYVLTQLKDVSIKQKGKCYIVGCVSNVKASERNVNCAHILYGRLALFIFLIFKLIKINLIIHYYRSQKSYLYL